MKKLLAGGLFLLLAGCGDLMMGGGGYPMGPMYGGYGVEPGYGPPEMGMDGFGGMGEGFGMFGGGFGDDD